MKMALTCVLVFLAMASTMAAPHRHKYSNSRARDAGAIMQGIGGLIGGLSEAFARQRQQQQQQMLERQRNLEIQQRQYELEKQRLALDRQRWREEADKQGIEICGYMIPSWLSERGGLCGLRSDLPVAERHVRP